VLVHVLDVERARHAVRQLDPGPKLRGHLHDADVAVGARDGEAPVPELDIADAALAARRRDGAADHAVRVIPLVGLGMPSFWIALLLVEVFSLRLRLFPVATFGVGVLGHLHAMFLPALTIAVAMVPPLVRSLRVALLRIGESDFVTTARAKGLGEWTVLRDHGLRNALVSTVTVLGVNVAYLVGGTLVVEKVFGLPGLGSLMIDAIFNRDFPVVQGVTFVFAVLVVLVNLVTDVVHALLDPRVAYP